eukprot:4233212-Prorocentrum_lima.AAC.1
MGMICSASTRSLNALRMFASALLAAGWKVAGSVFLPRCVKRVHPTCRNIWYPICVIGGPTELTKVRLSTCPVNSSSARTRSVKNSATKASDPIGVVALRASSVSLPVS